MIQEEKIGNSITNDETFGSIPMSVSHLAGITALIADCEQDVGLFHPKIVALNRLYNTLEGYQEQGIQQDILDHIMEGRAKMILDATDEQDILRISDVRLVLQ